MGKELTIIIFFLWSLQALRQALNWIYWWQTKEYRFDRFGLLLTSKEGRKNLEINLIGAKFITIFLSLFLGLDWAMSILLIWLSLKFLNEVVSHRIRKPVLTLRGVEVLATTLLGVILAVWIGYQSGNVAASVALGEVLILALPVVGVLWTTILVEQSKEKIIKKAKARLSIVKPFVIGVTGSFGKTTTKDFIAHLLSQKYKTEKTLANQNTDWGIARKAADLAKDTEIFVVEMGAYKKGEIKKVTEFVKPNLAVVTGIEPQHLALFGSLQNIKEAKYELIQALPKNGEAVFNGNNIGCIEMFEWAKKDAKKASLYEVLENANPQKNTELTISATKLSGIGSTIVIKHGGTKKTVQTALPGKYLLQNLGAAVLIARKLDVDWRSILAGIKTLEVPGKALRRHNLPSGGTVIDDSYNSTPHAFLAALDYLSLFKNKKVVFTPGIIELGSLSSEVHEEVGKNLAKTADIVVLTNSDFEDSIKKGLGGSVDKLRVITDPQKIAQKLEGFLRQNCTILLEGRMPGAVNKQVADELAKGVKR